MPAINIEDIAGVTVGEEHLHRDCFDGDIRELSLDDIITEEMASGDDYIFCAKCRKAL